MQLGAQQQADQYAVVAVQAGLPVAAVVAAALGGEQPGQGTEQRATEQVGGGEENRQQTEQAAQRVALEHYLAEAVEQSSCPIGAVDQVLGGHDGS
ncbi:hypothetical protein D9M71_790190 [compost metagenome]